MTLKSEAFGGLIWVSLSKIMLKFVNFVITIVLARLLLPADFGLVALALLFVNFFEVTRDLGMESALIHYDADADDEYNTHITYNTAFIIYPLFALLLYFASYLLAPYAATFFENKAIESIMRVLLLTIVIWSLGTLPRTLLIKNLKFKKMFIPQVLPKLTYGLSAIIMAYCGYGVWSLVVGRLILETTSVIAYWYSIEWRPSFVFSMEKASYLLSFGKHVAIASVISFIVSNIPIAFIGKLLSAESLGYYTVALSIAGMFTMQAAIMISQVLFPMYSKIHGNIGRLGDWHLFVIKMFSIFVLPASFGIIFISSDFIEVVYGSKWLPSVQVLQVLCIYGVFKSFNKINYNVLLAMGKPDVMTKVNYIQFFIVAILIWPFTMRYGIYGTSIVVTISTIMSSLYCFMMSNKLLNKSLYDIFNNITMALQGSIVMMIAMVIVHHFLINFSVKYILLANITTGFLIYVLYFIVFYKKDIYVLKGEIMQYLSNK